MLNRPSMSDVKTEPKPTEDEESVDAYEARISHHTGLPAASEVAIGAATGAVVGAMAGPIGVVAGTIVGGVVGAVSAATIAKEDARKAKHDAELDEAIGVTKGDLGATARQRRPAPEGAEAEDADDTIADDLADL